MKKFLKIILSLLIAYTSIMPAYATEASEREEIVELYTGQCGDDLYWSYTSNKVLTITGTGDMRSGYPRFINPENGESLPFESVVFSGEITSIGANAFYNCSSLTSIVIPEGVTSIEDYAFSDCSSLTSIVIPEGVTSIGEYAFYNCSSLTNINIPEGVTSIGSGAFIDCSSLTSIVIPKGVTSIGSFAFSANSVNDFFTILGVDFFTNFGEVNHLMHPIHPLFYMMVL